MTSPDTTVRAANLLTRRWAAELTADTNEVISGAGAWVLLATLLAASSGEAQGELERATSVERSAAGSSVHVHLQRLDLMEGVRSAIGLWARKDVPVNPDFAAAMEQLTVASLPADMGDLDRWASDQTGGLIEQFPGEITKESLLVVASALALEADWATPFEVCIDQWRGEGEWLGWLERTSRDPGAASLLSKDTLKVGRVACSTVDGFEVHLVSGSVTDAPGEVLGLAIDALHGVVEQVKGSELRLGDSAGCLSVREMAAMEPGPQLRLSLPAFEIQSNHDLLARSGLFGLTAAMDLTRGHFPHLSTVPLAVACARQAAMAGFSATGFKASTVTMAEMVLAGSPRETASVVVAEFDRPFGFLVVDPSSRLVLIAGWVPEPKQHFDPGEDDSFV